MRKLVKHVSIIIWLANCAFYAAGAQDLAPRAYVIAPIHSNAVTLVGSYSSGAILLDGVFPVPDAKGKIAASSFTYYHSFNLFGRYTNVTATLPYEVGKFTGTLMSNETEVDRSGLGEVGVRFSTNLYGGPAMDVPQFLKWRQKSVLGMSLIVLTPSGQYDPTRLINLGQNRWSFKPEVGYSHRLGHWVLDGYAGAWFFTKNNHYFSQNQYYPGINVQTQSPIGSFQGHLSYDLRRRLWASFDGNYWIGGQTSLNGVENPSTREKNSRLGTTLSVPLPHTTHQSLKFSYSDGVYFLFGGNFQTISAAWQYSWLGRPK